MTLPLERGRRHHAFREGKKNLSTWRRKKCRPGGLIGEKDKDDHVAWLKAYSSLALLMAVLLYLLTPSLLALILHLVS